ncbi:MAG: enolase C-terminal domain-like protein [Planctomycetales bacterium]|jgi:L-alanine-DL-glutamate epimerase-like enolase superfamily enzyme
MSGGGKTTDIRVVAVEFYLLPVQTRVPLKFGPEVMTEVTCARVRVTVEGRDGKTAAGWGECPLNVQWTWPSSLSYAGRHDRMVDFCRRIATAWPDFGASGHPLEVGSDFLNDQLPSLIDTANASAADQEEIPYLAALVCSSAFDVALHDAFGNLHGRDIYELYGSEHLSRDLSAFLKPASDAHAVSFANRCPSEFLVPGGRSVNSKMAAWHLVGGLDPLTVDDFTGEEPDDGYPVSLSDWIDHDGLRCLKIKLRGNDQDWDFGRIVKVGQLAVAKNCTWLTADFNCTVTDPEYVNEILDRLRDEHPRLYGMLLYIEQPFPYELERDRIDTRSIAARKPVFLDESAHDWQHVRLGRELGWSGVALKTCKTQTGAILSLCWAKAHGMPLMVQDLANPMLAQISHLRLAAHSGTIMGVETNGMQFYPDASLPEAAVHPGMFRRHNGSIDLSSLGQTGFGFRADEIARELPAPDTMCGDA